MSTRHTWATYTVTVEVSDGGLSEKGWHRLRDGLTDLDLESALHDAAIDAFANVLPRDFPDVLHVNVREVNPSL